jgi:hypothetical protein
MHSRAPCLTNYKDNKGAFVTRWPVNASSRRAHPTSSTRLTLSLPSLAGPVYKMVAVETPFNLSSSQLLPILVVVALSAPLSSRHLSIVAHHTYIRFSCLQQAPSVPIAEDCLSEVAEDCLSGVAEDCLSGVAEDCLSEVAKDFAYGISMSSDVGRDVATGDLCTKAEGNQQHLSRCAHASSSFARA